MKGSTFKRCKCRDDAGKELGAACPKLRRRDGSWNPRHGSWYFQLELEPGPNGKRRKTRRGGFDSDDDAQDALDAAKNKAARGVDPGSKLTVGKFLDEWLVANIGLRRSTEQSYGQHIEGYLKPYLGHLELDKLRVGHVAEMFAAIEAENERIEWANGERRQLRLAVLEAARAKDPAAKAEALEQLAKLPEFRRPVSAATMQRYRATLRSALSDAVRQGLVMVNVAKLVKLETGRRPKALVWTAERVATWSTEFELQVSTKAESRYRTWHYMARPSKVMVWTPAQTGAFLDQAAGHRLYALFHLIAFRGLRRGEVCGVGWDDVDLDAGTLMIRVQRVRISWSDIEESAPKTDASEDTIPLDAATVKALRAHRKRQLEDELAWGEAWVRSGKVFTRENGEALHPEMVTDHFMAIAYAAGLPPIRLHDLRHGAATLMLAGGADMKIVSALLRHSSIGITADTYTSVLPEVAREAAEAAVALVPRKAVGDDSGTQDLPTASQATDRRSSRRRRQTNQQLGASSTGAPRGIRTPGRRIRSQSEDVPDGDE